MRLTPESLVSNAVYWGADVPRRAVTAGMDLIMEARSVLVIVSGSHKQAILARMLEGEPSPDCPASLLRLRDGVTVAADRAALGSLVVLERPDVGRRVERRSGEVVVEPERCSLAGAEVQ